MSDDPHDATTTTLKIIQQFNDAFNQHRVDTIMSLMTEDCLFENTSPFPDGERYTGQIAVQAFWDKFFSDSPDAIFEYEDIFACGERAVVRWLYRWGEDGDQPKHIRGVDIFRLRDQKIAEKLSYVKG